jgi:hypothetical protein
VRFDLHDLSPALSIRFRLSRDVHPESMTGAKDLPAWLSLIDCVLEMLRGWLRRLGRTAPRPPFKRLPLGWRSYTARGGGEIVLRDMALPSAGKAAAVLWLKQDDKLKPGYEYHLDVLQFVRERMVGGASLLLPVAGDPRPNTGFAGVDWESERESAGQAESRPQHGGQ